MDNDTRNYLESILESSEAEFFEGFDEALLGSTYPYIDGGPVPVYSFEELIEAIQEKTGRSYQEAVEYFEMFLMDSYVGVDHELRPMVLMEHDHCEGQ